MSALTEQYLTYLRTDRKYSPTTIATYRRTYNSFPDIDTADRARVEEWWSSHTHKAPATRANELAAVRSFYKWARTWEHLPPGDPTERLITPRQPKRLPRPMSRHDLHQALAHADPAMRRAIALGAYAGLRVSEAAALDWSDLDLETRRLYVRHGKGDKDRAVALHPILLDALLPNTGGNVVTAGGHQYTPGALQQRVNRTLREAGVDGTFHKLRARFATVGLAGSGNLLAVSRALGHSTTATTALYAATSDDALDVIADAVTR